MLPPCRRGCHHPCLPAQAEALRVHLEQELGTGPFLAAFQRLEALRPHEDEGEVAREFNMQSSTA